MKVVFFGTSPFAARILEFISKQDLISIIGVVTRPDRPQGRSLQLKPPAVKEIASKLFSDIPIFQPEKASTDLFCETLKQLNPDLFLVVAYGEILKNNLLSLPKKACINIHASLLPKYRGAAPMQRCLMDGQLQSGITIIDMVLRMDAGDVLAQEPVDIPFEMNVGQLQEALLEASFRLLPRLLVNFDFYYKNKLPQDESRVTFANKILPSETEIHWSESAISIHNRVRALSPAPGAWCQIKIGDQMKRLKILSTHPLDHKIASTASLKQDGKKVFISCEEGSIELLQVQLEGKKVMTAGEFLKGIQEPIQFVVS